MTRITTIDNILSQGRLGLAFRILTTDLQWPGGDPPFRAGERVGVPAIPDSPAPYLPDEFIPAGWTDCTGLVSEYHYTQDAGMSIDQLSLSVPAAWGSADLARVFREMRVIVVQECYRGAGEDSGWVNRAWVLSDGFQESWEGGNHHYVVNAKDALKLANLEILGATSGSAVYQADVVTLGGYSAHAPLSIVAAASDAWECGFPLDIAHPTESAIQPNWADKPAPQFWCHNARDYDGNLYPESVPLAVGGDAAQCVFGEGVVRVGIGWARTRPGKGNDFSQGLGLLANETPDIRGVVARFAHPEVKDRAGNTVPSDLASGLSVVSVTGNVVRVNADITGKPAGLTLLLRDGTGRRYRSTAMTAGAGYTDIAITGSAPSIASGTPCSYGDANLVTDFVTRLLLDCGYQMVDANAPLYLHPPAPPVIRGMAVDIMLPPMVYHDTDGATALTAIEELRRAGYVPPNWILRADAVGQIYAGSITQLADGNAGVIPLSAVTALQYDRSDLGVSTRVVARGLVRQVDDLANNVIHPAVSIADWAGAEALPTPAYPLTASAVRAGASGQSYNFSLASLLKRNQPFPKEWNGKTLRPWGWFLADESTPGASVKHAVTLRGLWHGAVLAEIVLDAEKPVEAIELHTPSAWGTDKTDWGGGRHSGDLLYNDGSGWQKLRAHADPQVLGVRYYDAAEEAWKELISDLTCPLNVTGKEAVHRIEAADFVPRQAVTTARLQIVCKQPFFAEHRGERSGYDYNMTIGVWLYQVKIWSSAEIRGVAELGNAENYAGELSAAPWPAIRTRMRSRTYLLPDAVPWVSTQPDAEWLAIEWLKERTRDLAPRKVSAVRPDVRLWDTVSFTSPSDNEITGLVVSADHAQNGVASLTVVDYRDPYFE